MYSYNGIPGATVKQASKQASIQEEKWTKKELNGFTTEQIDSFVSRWGCPTRTNLACRTNVNKQQKVYGFRVEGFRVSGFKVQCCRAWGFRVCGLGL